MSITTWSMVWQVVVAGTCIGFCLLTTYISVGAIADARDMFRELAEDQPDENQSSGDYATG